MAKRSRHKTSRPARKKAPARAVSPARKPVIRLAVAPAAALERKSAPPPSPAAPATTRKPGYYEAIAIYEGGVRALQRHDFDKAADQFRQIIDRYPEERELHERSVLYLR